MVLEMYDTGKLRSDSRKGRFSEFMGQLYLLVGQLANETQKMAKTSLALSRILNHHLAFFLSDILDILIIEEKLSLGLKVALTPL